MRIRKSVQYREYIASQQLPPALISVFNVSPLDVPISSASADEQINQWEERFFRDATFINSAPDPKSSTEPAPALNKSTDGKVSKPPRVSGWKMKEVNAHGDDNIYDYYAGFRPRSRKRRGLVQNFNEASRVCKFDQNADKDNDDDEKPLKVKSVKSILEVADRALC